MGAYLLQRYSREATKELLWSPKSNLTLTIWSSLKKRPLAWIISPCILLDIPLSQKWGKKKWWLVCLQGFLSSDVPTSDRYYRILILLTFPGEFLSVALTEGWITLQRHSSKAWTHSPAVLFIINFSLLCPKHYHLSLAPLWCHAWLNVSPNVTHWTKNAIPEFLCYNSFPFFQYWGLSLGHPACQESALLFEPHPLSFCFRLFFR
jgi:hypothetical protein